MKKVLPILLVLAAVIAGAFVYFRNKPATNTPGRAAELAPADCLLFMELPDVARTIERWDGTALNKIRLEPEWKEFAGKAWDMMLAAPGPEVAETLSLIKEADPSNLFVAVRLTESPRPIMVIGCSLHNGKQTTVKAVIEKLKKGIFGNLSAPKSEIIKFEDNDLEHLTAGGQTHAVFAYRDNWFFMASEVEAMKSLLQRYKGGSASLAKDAQYLDTRKQTIADPDFFFYGNVGKLMEGANAALMPAGVPKPAAEKVQPWAAYALKLDGLHIRSRAYVRMPNLPKAPAMANRLTAFTNSDTYVYAAANVAGVQNLFRLMMGEANGDRLLKELAAPLSSRGINAENLPKIFGPEMSIHSDWEPVALYPNVFAAVEVRDAAKARACAELLAESMKGQHQMAQKEEDGTTYWTVSMGIVFAQPTVAVNDKHLIVAINYATAATAIKQLKTGGPGLGQSPLFQGTLKSVTAPTMGILYLDTKVLFERLYEKVKPMAAMELAGNPELSKYVDPAKFPKAGTISKHLTPTIITYSDAADGFIIESSGTIPIEAGMMSSALLVPVYAKGIRPPPPPAPATTIPAQPAAPPTTPAPPR